MRRRARTAPSAQFRWYALQTTDTAAAEAFYVAVVGWSAQNLGAWANGYVLFNTPKGAIAGMTRVPALEGPPRWTGYVAVSDVDAYVPKIQAAGGMVRHFPVNVPGVLRFAEAADPQGARFIVYRGFGAEDPPRGGPDEPGYVVWHQLATADPAGAFDFYRTVFGWTRAGAARTGLVQWSDGRGADTGDMIVSADAAPALAWTYAFQVDAIDAAAARIAQAGGEVTAALRQTPTGAWTLRASDPQGATFALISRRR